MKGRNEDIMEEWICIKYDYVPKYCKTCMIQGHNKKQCYIEYPELFPNKEKIDQVVAGGKASTENQHGKEKKEGMKIHIKGGNQQSDKKVQDFIEQRHRKG
ncbi:hypothetical protein EJD97_020815, partial [Solanum chilense]